MTTAPNSAMPIWTLEARGNMLLTSMTAYLKMSSIQVRHEIKRAHWDTVSVLRHKGVDYGRLRTSLEPSRDKSEIALMFDIDKLGSGNYATAASRQIVPALRPKAFHSILEGDLVGGPLDSLHLLVVNSIVASKTFDMNKVGFYYVVYINNLTGSDVQALCRKLDSFPAYAGHIPCNLNSSFRTVASHMLAASYLKAGKLILSGHEDDVTEDQDWHLGSWDWEGSGYEHRSVADHRFGLVLSYKIEREPDGPFSDDERFALNAISDKPSDVSLFVVEIAAMKLEYLRREKSGTLKRLGLADIGLDDLSGIIQDKLRGSYIYNLRYREEYDVSLFNLLLELRDTHFNAVHKVMASLRYDEPNQSLRLVTLY